MDAFRAQLDPQQRLAHVQFPIHNRTSSIWKVDGPVVVGWQLFDPDTNLFIAEGEWQPLRSALAPGDSSTVDVDLPLPAVPGRYHVYFSTLHPDQGWSYQRGESFALLDLEVDASRSATVHSTALTTLRRLKRRKFRSVWSKAFRQPVDTIWRNRSLIHSMVKRDLLVRYRGSAGDFIWTFLNPLLLMATYFFVFGVVMKTRFGADASRTGYVLYFLAGMLPWLAISEALGRASTIVIQNANVVKKLVFPVETLPVNLVAAGLITQAVGTVIYLVGLAIVRGGLPASLIYLPVVLIPQILLTLGVTWLLAGVGVFLRDLGQIMGFVLTVIFFLTPIAYSDVNLPPGIAPFLTSNPVYVIVRSYRIILLEGRAPYLPMTLKLWALSIFLFFLGHAVFYKLRKSFVDVL